MSVLDLFQDKHPAFEYYGKSDLSTGLLVSRLLDNKIKLIEYINNIDSSKMDIELFIDYNWLANMVEIEEIIPNVIETRRQEFSELIALLKETLKKIDDHKIRTFIGSEYSIIFSKETYGERTLVYHKIVQMTFETIYRFFSFFSDKVFDYLETNFGYMIVRKIQICEAYYKKHQSNFRLIFEKPKNQMLFSIYNFHQTFNNLSKSKQEFVQAVIKEYTDKVMKEVIENAKGINGDNYIEIFPQIEPIIKLVKINPKLRTVDLYQIDKLDKTIEKASKEYFEKHGQQWNSEPINLKPAVDILKKGISNEDRGTSFVNFLSLTHSFKKDFKIIKSNLSTVEFGKKSTDLLDFMDHTPNTDDYFTSNAVFQLNTLIDLNVIALFHVLKDEKVERNFYEHLKTELIDIDHNESNGDLGLLEMLNGFYPIFIKKQRMETNELSSEDKYDIYSNSLFIITLIERILRRVAINRNSESVYYSEDNINLADILRTKNTNGSDYTNSMLNRIFDHELIRSLEYYLVKTSDSNIGLNMRNDLAHNRNIPFLKLNSQMLLKVFYLFLSVVNAIYVSYINHNNLARKKQDSE